MKMGREKEGNVQQKGRKRKDEGEKRAMYNKKEERGKMKGKN
jgi:hypothetical protein